MNVMSRLPQGARLIVVLCFGGLLAAPAAWAQQDAVITPNFRDADIREIVEAVGEVTGRSFILDPRVNAKVTVLSSTPMSAEAFYETFLSILQVHGYVAIDTGDLVKIIPDATARQFPSQIGTEGAAPVQARAIKRDLEDRLPRRICFYGEGVRLACEGSPVLDQLPDLAVQFFGVALGSRELQRVVEEAQAATLPYSDPELQRRLTRLDTAVKDWRLAAPRQEGRHQLDELMPDMRAAFDALGAALGGLPLLAPLHTFLAWAFAAFIVMHIYLTTTGETPLSGIKAMVTGWEDVEVHAGHNQHSSKENAHV